MLKPHSFIIGHLYSCAEHSRYLARANLFNGGWHPDEDFAVETYPGQPLLIVAIIDQWYAVALAGEEFIHIDYEDAEEMKQDL